MTVPLHKAVDAGFAAGGGCGLSSLLCDAATPVDSRGCDGAGFPLPQAVDVCGLPVRPLRADELIDAMIARTAGATRTRVSYLNAHTFNLAQRDETFCEALASSDVLYADGQSVVWAARRRGRHLPERMTAADFFPALARRCAETGLSLYLLGGAPGVAMQAAARLSRLTPGLRIAGTHDGFFDEAASSVVVARINAVRPDVLAVGMGSPRQEVWLRRHGDAIDAPLQWSVGALLDYLAGTERRGPAWLRNRGGEWLCRLIADPAGKWRRYLIGNIRFVATVLRYRAPGAPGSNATTTPPQRGADMGSPAKGETQCLA